MLEPGKFRESQERTIYLLDTEPLVFMAFAEYLYYEEYFPYQKSLQHGLGARDNIFIEHLSDTNHPRQQRLYSSERLIFITKAGWKATNQTHELFLYELQIYRFADKYDIDDLQARVVDRLKEFYPINLDEIFALARLKLEIPREEKGLKDFLLTKIRDRKNDLSVNNEWKEIVEAGVETGFTWEVVQMLSR